MKIKNKLICEAMHNDHDKNTKNSEVASSYLNADNSPTYIRSYVQSLVFNLKEQIKSCAISYSQKNIFVIIILYDSWRSRKYSTIKI